MSLWIRTSLGVATIVVTLATAAAATDLTGVWTGSVHCRSFDGARRSIPSREATLRISQLGRYFAAQVEHSRGVRSYNGEVVPRIGRTSRVEAVLIECRSSPELNNYSEVVNLRGTVIDSRGRLSGESIFRNQVGDIGTCRWSLERSSSKQPSISFCQ